MHILLYYSYKITNTGNYGTESYKNWNSTKCKRVFEDLISWMHSTTEKNSMTKLLIKLIWNPFSLYCWTVNGRADRRQFVAGSCDTLGGHSRTARSWTSQRGGQVAVHALPDPEQVKDEVRWPFMHCQILKKSERSDGPSRTARSWNKSQMSGGRSRTARSWTSQRGGQVAVHALPNTEQVKEEVCREGYLLLPFNE